MPFSRVAEMRIREALAQGEFDNLPGAGKPLDLEEYFSMREDLRMAYSILKNASCAPVEVELLKEVARLQEQVAQARDASEKQALQRRLATRQTELAVLLERAAASARAPR